MFSVALSCYTRLRNQSFLTSCRLSFTGHLYPIIFLSFLLKGVMQISVRYVITIPDRNFYSIVILQHSNKVYHSEFTASEFIAYTLIWWVGQKCHFQNLNVIALFIFFICLGSYIHIWFNSKIIIVNLTI